MFNIISPCETLWTRISTVSSLLSEFMMGVVGDRKVVFVLGIDCDSDTTCIGDGEGFWSTFFCVPLDISTDLAFLSSTDWASETFFGVSSRLAVLGLQYNHRKSQIVKAGIEVSAAAIDSLSIDSMSN
jgi:hypothetical protein